MTRYKMYVAQSENTARSPTRNPITLAMPGINIEFFCPYMFQARYVNYFEQIKFHMNRVIPKPKVLKLKSLRIMHLAGKARSPYYKYVT